MKMSFNKKCFSLLTLMLLICGGIYADEPSSGLSADYMIEDGIYENDGHYFIIKDNEPYQEVLKSFYTFWYDGLYDVEDGDQAYLAQIDDGLYLDWWHREDLAENKDTGGVFWAPGSNVRELAISPYPVKERLSGYFVLPGESGSSIVYEIPYWTSDIECSDELASFKLDDGSVAYVNKNIQIGETVYTCAAGRRKTVRNPELKQSLPGTPLYSKGGVIMVLNAPYLVRADIDDMKAEIAAHNAIPRPPRFSTTEMKEPSIYKMLEDMPIEW